MSGAGKYYFVFLFCCACTYHKSQFECEEVKITYSKIIAPIIEANCNSFNCHGGGAYVGDFTSYQGLKQKIENGSFRLRVLELKLMPPPQSEPLKEIELKKIECWLNQGAIND